MDTNPKSETDQQEDEKKPETPSKRPSSVLRSQAYLRDLRKKRRKPNSPQRIEAGDVVDVNVQPTENSDDGDFQEDAEEDSFPPELDPEISSELSINDEAYNAIHESIGVSYIDHQGRSRSYTKYSPGIISFDDAVEILLFPNKIPKEKLCDSTPKGPDLLTGGAYIVDLQKLKSWKLIKEDNLGKYGGVSTINRWYRWEDDEYRRIDSKNKLPWGEDFSWQIRCSYARNNNYKKSFQRKIYEARDPRGKLQKVAVIVYHVDGENGLTAYQMTKVSRRPRFGRSLGSVADRDRSDPIQVPRGSQDSSSAFSNRSEHVIAMNRRRVHMPISLANEPEAETEFDDLADDPPADRFYIHSGDDSKQYFVGLHDVLGRRAKEATSMADCVKGSVERDADCSSTSGMDFAFGEAERALDEAIKKCRDAKILLKKAHWDLKGGRMTHD